VSQEPSSNSPPFPFGIQGATFQIGSNLVKRRKLREKKANTTLNFAMSSPQHWEGIGLLRQIFSEETDDELDGIHTNYLQPNSSKATAEAETRTAKQKTQRSQS
jgi:hypothetical protein